MQQLRTDKKLLSEVVRLQHTNNNNNDNNDNNAKRDVIVKFADIQKGGKSKGSHTSLAASEV